jgi:uncharacterized protein YlxW (UPF0749 family)
MINGNSGQIPVDAVPPNEIPVNNRPKWNDICMILGNLYLEYELQRSNHEANVESIVSHQKAQFDATLQENQELHKEVKRLSEELEKARGTGK